MSAFVIWHVSAHMNEQIFSRFTFVTKWLFPLAWFGFILFFVVDTLTNGPSADSLPFIIVSIVMAVMGFFFSKAPSLRTS